MQQPLEQIFLPCTQNNDDNTLFMQVSITSVTDNHDGIKTQVSVFECTACGEEKIVTQTYKTCKK